MRWPLLFRQLCLFSGGLHTINTATIDPVRLLFQRCNCTGPRCRPPICSLAEGHGREGHGRDGDRWPTPPNLGWKKVHPAQPGHLLFMALFGGRGPHRVQGGSGWQGSCGLADIYALLWAPVLHKRSVAGGPVRRVTPPDTGAHFAGLSVESTETWPDMGLCARWPDHCRSRGQGLRHRLSPHEEQRRQHAEPRPAQYEH